MEHLYLQPVKKWHSNSVLKAAPGTEDYVKDLHITRVHDVDEHPAVVSVWKVQGWRARWRLFWTGEVTFLAIGYTHPPIQISAGDTYDQAKKPETDSPYDSEREERADSVGQKDLQ